MNGIKFKLNNNIATIFLNKASTKNSLNRNGTSAIQGITIGDHLFDRYKNDEDFIQKYIFPGGFLPSVNFIKTLIKKNKLELIKMNTYSDDYAKTLHVWRGNFFKNSFLHMASVFA